MDGRLPSELTQMTAEDGTLVVKVLREVMFYKVAFSVEEHDALITLYKRYCSQARDRFFKIPELSSWSPVRAPALTMSAREQRSKPLAEFEAVRRRIAERRWFFSKLWDGHEIDDEEGSWSLDIERRRAEDGTWHGFVRILLPLDVADETHIALARDVVEAVSVNSGHGGYVFAYRPERKATAFDRIYAASRRFKGIDIEDLKVTLPHMRSALKPPCWLNILGRDGAHDPTLWRALVAMQELEGVEVMDNENAMTVRLSARPELFNVNHRDAIPESYRRYSALTAPARLSDIGTFSGPRFADNPDATPEWLARFDRLD